jgi:putative GTP pyrophosphokinase
MDDATLDTRRRFFEEYKSYAEEILFPTQREVKAILDEWKKPDYWIPNRAPVNPTPLVSSGVIGETESIGKRQRGAAPSPIHRVRLRVKRAESVEDKILRRPDVFTTGLSSDSFRKMNDTLGVRVILYFLSYLPLIDRELRKLNDILEISEENPPKAYLSDGLTRRLSLVHLNPTEKESGYASIHYNLRLKDSAIPHDRRPWFELQVRTLVEDVWGEIEHVLGYKPEKRTSFAVRRQFQLISNHLGVIDEHFNFLHGELTRIQEEVEYDESAPLNAENLPPELSSMGLGCAQSEIDGLLKVLISRKIPTVAALREVATPRRVDVIRNTFYNVEGRPPRNFEFVAHLATLVGCDEENEMIARIKEQIDYLKGWESVKFAERASQIVEEKKSPKQ